MFVTYQVHRLDRDSSGILIMGRTQTSATVLHSIFREKTFGASKNVSLLIFLQMNFLFSIAIQVYRKVIVDISVFFFDFVNVFPLINLHFMFFEGH